MKKSIRRTKKKFKAEQMRKWKVCCDLMPSFLEIVKWHRDVIDTLGINIDVECRSYHQLSLEYYKRPIYFFDEIYKELSKVFSPRGQVIFNPRECKLRWLHELMRQRDQEDVCRTKDREMMF